MNLLDKTLLGEFKKIGDQSDNPDPLVICKFFNPTGAGSWYAISYDPVDKVFFGYVSIFRDHNDELGSFSLKEISEFREHFGLGIERDLFFKPTKLSEIKKQLYG